MRPSSPSIDRGCLVVRISEEAAPRRRSKTNPIMATRHSAAVRRRPVPMNSLFLKSVMDRDASASVMPKYVRMNRELPISVRGPGCKISPVAR